LSRSKGKGGWEVPYYSMKSMRCSKMAQRARSSGPSAAWRLGDAPVSNSRAELGVGAERAAGVDLLHVAMLLRRSVAGEGR